MKGHMRMHWSGAAVVGAALALSACAPARGQLITTDKTFLKHDSQGNVAEVELAKLALSKSQNPDVRAFAQRMIKDHETLATRMKPFLDKDGIQPSTSLDSEHQSLYNKLKGLNGTDFDKEYVKAMDKDHHEDYESFTKEINSTKDPELKSAVTDGRGVIAQHTQMIDGLTTKMGMKPAGPPVQ